MWWKQLKGSKWTVYTIKKRTLLVYKAHHEPVWTESVLDKIGVAATYSNVCASVSKELWGQQH